MFVAQIQFPFDSSKEDDEAQDIVSSVLGSMWQNGQISVPGYSLLESPQGFTAFLTIPAEDALEERHYNKWVKSGIARFVAIGGQRPTFTVIGADAESDGPCQCSSPHGYIVYTQWLSSDSPLRCALCFEPVPLYRVPPTYDQSEYWNLRHWEADYQACDTLQMHCTVLESATMGEMSHLGSALTQAGLEICRLISASTEQPVYYYLYAYGGGDLASEEKRKCPNCGGEWLLTQPWHNKFDFKCDQCHLLSNIAFDVREACTHED